MERYGVTFLIHKSPLSLALQSLTSSGKGRSQRVLVLLALFGNHSASLRLYKVGEGPVRSLLGHQQLEGTRFPLQPGISSFILW